MDKEKVTRRAALGAAVGTVVAAPTIIATLRGKYIVNVPDGSSAGKVGGKVVTTYQGREISAEVPEMDLRTPEDEKKLKSALREQLKENAEFAEANKVSIEEWKNSNIKSAMVRLDEEEKRQLEQLAKLPGSEDERRTAAKQIRAQIQAARTKLLEQIRDIEDLPTQ